MQSSPQYVVTVPSSDVSGLRQTEIRLKHRSRNSVSFSLHCAAAR
jgi:hypothetical protein